MLKVSRGMIYYTFTKRTKVDAKLENDIIEIFNSSRGNDGTKKINEKLEQLVSDDLMDEIKKLLESNKSGVILKKNADVITIGTSKYAVTFLRQSSDN